VADLGDGRRVVIVDGEVGPGRLRTLDEQTHCVELVDALEAAVARQAQGPNRELMLALDAQNGAARHDHGEVAASSQQLQHQRRGAGQLLEVVQDQQGATVAQEVPDDV
jgi:hypothetical protein